MTRPTLANSLAALADELHALDRESWWARIKADSARSAAEYEGQKQDDDSQQIAAHHLASASRHEGRSAALESIRSRLDRIGQALGRDDAAWLSERSTYADVVATLGSVERRAAPVDLPPPPPPVPVGPTADTLLSVAAAPIVAARVEALGQAVRDSSRYGERVETALAAFIQIVGDKPLRDYMPTDVQTFVNVLARVPLNRTKGKAFAGMSYRQAADANDRMPEDQRRRRLSSSSVKGYVSDFLPTWSAVSATVPGLRDLGAVNITAPRGAAPATTREGLSTEALNIWLAAAADQSDPHLRWLPLLGLVTGMRLSELVYLQGRDFRTVDGNLVIDLRGPIVVNGASAARPLKTTTSFRLVALHPILDEVGFVAWAKGIDGFLFPSFHRAEDPGDAAQKRMGHWMGKLGIRERQKGVFHSLRHNAKSWMRIHVGERVADFQCGHAPTTVGAKYGFRILQAEEVEAIMAAPQPRGIEFSPYMKEPTQPMRKPRTVPARPAVKFKDVPNLAELRRQKPVRTKRGRGASA